MSGSLAMRLTGAEDLIAASSAFQTHVGVGSAEAAKAHIYFGEQGHAGIEKGATLQGMRPGVILVVDRHGYVQIGEGSQICLGATGAIGAIFVDNPATPDNHKASLLAFADWISTVMDEVAGEVGRDTNWPFNGAELAVEPYRPSITDRASDDFWLAMYLLSDHVNAPGG